MKVLCLLANGYEEGEALMPTALLRRGGVEVEMVTLNGDEASGKHNISVNHLRSLDEINSDDFGMLMLPGGPGVDLLEKDERVIRLIHKFVEEDKYIAAICAAPTILGRLGLLKGKNYTCFTNLNRDFGGNYIDEYTCIDGKLITGRSVAASIDFGLLMLETIMGQDTSKAVKERIYY